MIFPLPCGCEIPNQFRINLESIPYWKVIENLPHDVEREAIGQVG